jgi:hypothetical protein
MRRLGTRSPWVLLLALVVLAATAVGALGYWGGGGGGTGTARLAEPGALSLAPGTPAAALHPGGAADVATVVSNPNPYSVRIGSLALGTGAPFVADPGHVGCGVGALSFVRQTNAGAGWLVPPRVGTTAGTLAIDLPEAIRMSAAAASTCQDATFTVALEVGP